MTGPWRTPRGPIAFTSVMGLVLLSLLLVGSTYNWHGGGRAYQPGFGATQTWTPEAWDAQLSSMPPQTATGERQVLPLWPPLRGERHHDAGRLAMSPAPGLDPGGIRDPQQLAHRTAGSRSPPLI
ncbi:hypothetical protein [Nonomuraea sp. B5E05]|uniref:hypothetical protein n=1 Tax=Nonomuraea sp. B5E05 TaxID=3153569 RepID=UPI003260088F